MMTSFSMDRVCEVMMGISPISIDIFGYRKYRQENKNIAKYREKKSNQEVNIKKIV